MNAVRASHVDAAEDHQLAELVEEITARLQRGEPCDASDYAARYPEYAERLHNWMSVMSAMADMGHSLAGGRHERRVEKIAELERELGCGR